ncbi:MAG: Cof-type HAD-IIB family hydrolase [Clostridia bacterium]|nr:Cof-type HAD-IIB family hydrolase [Clostridia bacterium]
MKTLYLTDLDGTLLRPDATLSELSRNALNSVIERGAIFSFATARSYNTAMPLLEGVKLNMPMIVHNGSFIVRQDQTTVYFNGFTAEAGREVFETFLRFGLCPVVYSVIEGRNRMSFLQSESSPAQTEFAVSRMDDKYDKKRVREIFSRSSALDGDVYYFCCVDEENKLRPVYEELKNKNRCFFGRDMYSGEWWLEVMPKSASKAEAAKKLKELLECDKLVAFGDATNDIPMFEVADECYAVENAAEELKRIANGIILSNKEDGVARWLLEHAR